MTDGKSASRIKLADVVCVRWCHHFQPLNSGHFDKRDTIFSKVAEVGRKLKSKKFHLFQQKVVYLGHIISPLGISTNPAIEAIKSWPTPKNASVVRS